MWNHLYPIRSETFMKGPTCFFPWARRSYPSPLEVGGGVLGPFVGFGARFGRCRLELTGVLVLTAAGADGVAGWCWLVLAGAGADWC